MTKAWLWCFVALLVLLPLPFGSNRWWVSDAIGGLAAVLLLWLVVDVFRGRVVLPLGAPVRRLAVSAALFVMVLIWGWLQTQSWLPIQWHHPLWGEVQSMSNARAGSVSLNPTMMPEHILRMLIYAVMFVLGFFAAQEREHAKFIITALAIAAVIYALYGLFMQSTGLRMILWYDKWTYLNFVTSTFVNKNSYATYAAIGLQCCIALLWLRLREGLRGQSHKGVTHHKKGSSAAQPVFARLIEFLGTRGLLYALPLLIVLGALLMTASRAGIAAGFVGCLVLLLALAINRRWGWQRWLPMLVVTIIMAGTMALLSDSLLWARISGEDLSADTPVRLAAYDVTMRAIADNPWLGFGLGSFDGVFRMYRDADMKLWFQHAHNDYLEMALELGGPAFTMLLLAITILLSYCMVGVWRRRRDGIYPALAVGVSVTVGLHSLVDFGMHIPAIAATWAVVLGVGVAQSRSSRIT